MTDSTIYKKSRPPGVYVSTADADLLAKIHRILESGKNVNVEIKKDTNGSPKVLKVSKEIAL